MGVGHLNIAQGTGDATVWNTQPAIQSYVNLLAQQKAQRQAENDVITNQLASVKTNGLRDADVPDYQTKYNDWKNTVIGANNLPKNSPERLSKLAEAQNKYDNINAFIAKSKQAGADHKQIGNMLLQDSFRHQFKDDAVDKYVKSDNLPMSDSNFINDPNTLERQPDNAKVDDKFDKIGSGILKQSEWSNPIQSAGKDKQGNKTGTVVYNERKVDPVDLFHAYATQYDFDKDVKKSLQDRYPQIQGANDQETKALRLKQLMVDRDEVEGLSEKTKPTFKPDKTDNYYAHYDYAHPNGAGGGEQLTPAQTLITNMKDQVPGSGEKLMALAPTGQYGKAQPFVGIDRTTGNHIFRFPAQVELDKKATEESEDKQPVYKTKAPNKNYEINPNSPDYVSEVAKMAAEQNINLSKLNQIEAKKGTRGQIPQVQNNSSKTEGMVTMTLPDGTTGQIPQSKVADFLKKYPKAKRY